MFALTAVAASQYGFACRCNALHESKDSTKGLYLLECPFHTVSRAHACPVSRTKRNAALCRHCPDGSEDLPQHLWSVRDMPSPEIFHFLETCVAPCTAPSACMYQAVDRRQMCFSPPDRSMPVRWSGGHRTFAIIPCL